GAGEHPAGSERAHRHEAEAGAEELRHLARKMRLADARLTEQQHRWQLDRVVGIDAQRKMFADVLQHRGEVGQRLEELIHLRQRRKLHREALAAELEHLLVDRAQRLVRPWREFLQRLLDAGDVVDVLEPCDRSSDVSRHLSPTFLFYSPLWLLRMKKLA